MLQEYMNFWCDSPFNIRDDEESGNEIFLNLRILKLLVRLLTFERNRYVNPMFVR